MARRKASETQALYKRVFESDDGKAVMADLRRFCFGTQTTAVTSEDKRIDEKAMLIHEGRRQVLMQIVTHMKINFEEIFDYEDDDYDI